MAKNLTLNLSYPKIRDAIRVDTYITGQIDKSADMVKNAALAFNEQAGDESYHERKIYRTVKGALAKFEAQLAEFIETSDPDAKIVDTLDDINATSFTIVAQVNDRTSAAFQAPLAYLAQEFIVNTSLYYWWQPIKPALAKDYLTFAIDNLSDVRRCLAKCAPADAGIDYDDISGEVTPITPVVKKTYEAQNINVSEIPLQGVGFIIPLSDLPSGKDVTFDVSNYTGIYSRPYIIEENQQDGTDIYDEPMEMPYVLTQESVQHWASEYPGGYFAFTMVDTPSSGGQVLTISYNA